MSADCSFNVYDCLLSRYFIYCLLQFKFDFQGTTCACSILPVVLLVMFQDWYFVLVRMNAFCSFQDPRIPNIVAQPQPSTSGNPKAAEPAGMLVSGKVADRSQYTGEPRNI